MFTAGDVRRTAEVDTLPMASRKYRCLALTGASAGSSCTLSQHASGCKASLPPSLRMLIVAAFPLRRRHTQLHHIRGAHPEGCLRILARVHGVVVAGPLTHVLCPAVRLHQEARGKVLRVLLLGWC